jgi:uncharacterized protein YkwD
MAMSGLLRPSSLVVLALAASCATVPDLIRPPGGAEGATGQPAPPSQEPAAATRPPVIDEAVERQVHDQVNRHRRSRGLAPLTANADLTTLAREHSIRMALGAVPVGHESFESRFDAAREAIGIRGMSENVATNNFPAATTAIQVVQGWVGSEVHRRNLEGGFQLAGVGVARSATGEYFVTQLYATR